MKIIIWNENSNANDGASKYNKYLSSKQYLRDMKIKFRKFSHNSRSGNTAWFVNICFEKQTLPRFLSKTEVNSSF